MKKIVLFIDGWGLTKVARDYFGKGVDFRKLLEYFSRDAFLLRAFYYTGEVSGSDEERRRQQSFLTFLRRNGYRVVTRPIRTYIDEKGLTFKRADFDADMAMDMLELADRIDEAVLISGDGNLARIVKRLANRGVRIKVVFHWERGKGPADPRLIETADEFVDLEEIINYIARPIDRGHEALRE